MTSTATPRPAPRDAPPTPVLRASTGTLLDDHDVLLLDLDGVVYVGGDAVPHAPEALAAAVEGGTRLRYVTNNASRPPAVVAEHLTALGAPASTGDVVTSAQAAARHLADTLPAGSPVLLVGGEGLRLALEEVGLRPVTALEDEPVAVVQGFSPLVDWATLTRATHAVRAGLPWTATNLDATVPSPGGPAPGNGLLVDLVARAAGRRPGTVCGKPSRAVFDEAVQRSGARSALVVGDRLDTDLEGARAADLPGLLVLTGVTGVAELLAAGPGERPAHVAHDLRGLRSVHPGVEVDVDDEGVTATCRGARARAGADGVRVLVEEAGPDGLDVLRAAAEAVWQHRDRGGAEPADPAAGVAAVTAAVVDERAGRVGDGS